MKEIVVLSGKGGTGKTSLTASFALLAGNSILCDTDVDAADLHLLLAPRMVDRHDFIGGHKAVINSQKCTSCGLCRQLCRYQAVSDSFLIDDFACEGCGVCVDLCPEQAIDFPEQRCGEWYLSATEYGAMFHARLGIAEENSGRLVSLIRQQARDYGETTGAPLIITDGPPGIGCPVIASLGGASAAVIVVEPTVSGLHDMERVTDLAAHFKVPVFICVNKFDINYEMTQKIEEYSEKKNLVLLGRIPFDECFIQAMIAGKTVVEYAPESLASQSIRAIWQSLREAACMQHGQLKMHVK